MLIGCARVSTADQAFDLQTDELKKTGCERIFHDIAGGAKTQRQGLTDAVELLRKGDVLVVWKLDRLGRSLQRLIETGQALDKRGIGFKKSSGVDRHHDIRWQAHLSYLRVTG
jgi:DNA invertase Pin-like site-specific DNA recombinase